MANDKAKILIIEDDLDVADMLTAYFRVQGYEVQTVNWGEDGIRACLDNPPDLILLDIRLPDIDGYEVVRRLRKDRRRQTAKIPIIFLTERRSNTDRLSGLELGADDYITKPFDVQELRLRVRNALGRSSYMTLTNPITHLPEGVLVDERLSECLEQQDWAIILVSIEHLDKFRELYGFVASDDVLRALSLMLHNAVRETGSPNDFIGQYSSTEFIIATTPNNLKDLADRISNRLEQSMDYFYPLRDRGREDMEKTRLSIQIMKLSDTDGPFGNLAVLKERLSPTWS